MGSFVQEVFLGQLYELHRMVQLQRHLVSVCDKPEAVTAELAKLEAEQYLRHQASSDVTVEQVPIFPLCLQDRA